MNEKSFREALEELLLGEVSLEDSVLDEARSILSFEDAALLTHDEGLVVRMLDGTEFQITIRQSH